MVVKKSLHSVGNKLKRAAMDRKSSHVVLSKDTDESKQPASDPSTEINATKRRGRRIFGAKRFGSVSLSSTLLATLETRHITDD